MASALPPAIRLEMRNITKSFGGVAALAGVSLDVRASEIHALCGENGAGKSTLMKILSGAITDYEGELFLHGQPVRLAGPRDAEERGVSIIYQELNLVPDLSAAANIFLGRETTRAGAFLADRAMEQAAAEHFRQLGTTLDPRAKVRDLRIGDRQLVEIAKALSLDADILIMDEPTSALADAEVARLVRVIEDLRSRGVAIIYISHKMDEVFRLADRITVLRDGRRVATVERAASQPGEIIRLMVGRELSGLSREESRSRGVALLQVDGLCLPHADRPGSLLLQRICLTLHAGEILGVAGLLGAGRTELLECLFGAQRRPPSEGRVWIDGKPARIRSPADALRRGMALVTEDRKGLGLFADLSVAENITLCHLDRLEMLGMLTLRRERAVARDAVARFGIKTANVAAPILSLSGGNQQKCILARWLLTNPRILLLDEPTRGIDVGAKAEIYCLLRDLAAQGMGIIMTSSELPELLAVCDRILVLCEGRKTAEFDAKQATEEAILHAAMDFRKPTAAA